MIHASSHRSSKVINLTTSTSSPLWFTHIFYFQIKLYPAHTFHLSFSLNNRYFSTASLPYSLFSSTPLKYLPLTLLSLQYFLPCIILLFRCVLILTAAPQSSLQSRNVSFLKMPHRIPPFFCTLTWQHHHPSATNACVIRHFLVTVALTLVFPHLTDFCAPPSLFLSFGCSS